MLTTSHIIKQNATLPVFEIILRGADDQPVDLTDASSIIFRMTLIGDSSVVKQGICDVIDETEGRVSYQFAGSDTQISGTYLARILVTFSPSGSQVFPFNDYYLIEVESDLDDDENDLEVELVFATVEQARSMGYNLTPQELLRAQGHIGAVCGRTVDVIKSAIEAENLTSNDIAILTAATVYQAVWIKANPDVEERTDVTQIRTAGLSGESAILTTDGIIIAPFARRLLTRLSWVRTRSIRTSVRKKTGLDLGTINGSTGGFKNL